MPTQLTNSSEQLNDSSGGWIPQRNITWIRTGNSTLIVAGNLTGTYQPGTCVWWLDSGVGNKYGVVGSTTFLSGTTTTINLISTSDYIVSGTVTSPQISYLSSPLGFPQGFTFAKSYTGFSADPSQTIKWSTIGNRLFLSIATASNGTSNATTFTMSLPVTVAQNTIQYANVTDNGVEKNGLAYAAAATTTLTYYAGAFGTAFVNSGTKGGSTALSYLF